MGTVPMGTGELRMIHSRVSWMLRPVERSMTVSAPQRIDQTILSTSAATSEATAELPILALILTRKLRPIAIGSGSGWVGVVGGLGRSGGGGGGADRRRLGFRVVDVVGDDGAAAGDLVADEFGGDVVGDGGSEVLAVAG